MAKYLLILFLILPTNNCNMPLSWQKPGKKGWGEREKERERVGGEGEGRVGERETLK